MDRHALYTAAPVSRRIAFAAGLDAKEAEAILRHLRKLMANGTVRASVVPSGSGTAPNLFNEADVYRAAIAFRLSRIGLSDEMVKSAVPFLWYNEGERDGSDFLWRAIEGMIGEPYEPYFFHLFMAPDYFAIPGNVQFGSFSKFQDAGKVHPDGATAWYSTITIPLRGLVANLHATDNESVGPLPPKGQ